MFESSRSLRTVFVLSALLGCLPGVASAAWLPLSAPGSLKAPTWNLTKAASRLSIDLEIPGIDLEDQGDFTAVELPEGSRHKVPREPELPIYSWSLALPPGKLPKVRLVALEEVEVALEKPVLPSLGHLTREVPISKLPREMGPAYQSPQAWPQEDYPLEVSRPFVLRDLAGVHVSVMPVLYLPRENKLRVLTRARLEVDFRESEHFWTQLELPQQDLQSEFVELYRRSFANLDEASFAGRESQPGRSLILVPDAWAALVEPLAAWHREKGLGTQVLPLSQVGSDSASIQARIRSEYQAGGLSYVLFVGDSDAIPPLKGENEKADCDSCYGKLAGSDHVPDIFLSRFSAKTADEVKVQVERVLRYETAPLEGAQAEVYRQAVGIASNEGRPPDYDRVEKLRQALLAKRFSKMDQLYDKKGWRTPKVQPGEVQKVVDQGRGWMAYMGHGSKTRWVTSSFSTSHIRKLKNTSGAWPAIWDVACVNGDFAQGSDSFAEAWAKAGTPAQPAGAIAIVAATTNMSWDPPVDWQNAVLTKVLLKDQATSGGAMHLEGLLLASKRWGSSAKSEGVKMIEQCVYFGDASVSLRSRRPARVSLAKDANSNLILKSSRGPLSDAQVVVWDGATPHLFRPEAGGRVALPPELSQKSELLVSVSGRDLVPLIRAPLPE